MAEIDFSALRVSDHALVRYMERVKGIDLEPMRQEVRAWAGAHAAVPAPPIGIELAATIVIEILGDPIVTTVLGPSDRPKKARAFTRLIRVPNVPAEGIGDG